MSPTVDLVYGSPSGGRESPIRQRVGGKEHTDLFNDTHMKLLVFLSTATSPHAGGFRGTLSMLEGLADRGVELHVRSLYASRDCIESLSVVAESQALHSTDRLPPRLLYSDFLFHKAAAEYTRWMRRSSKDFKVGCPGLLFGDFPVQALEWAKVRGILTSYAVYAWGLPSLYPHFPTGRSALRSSARLVDLIRVLSPILDRRFQELQRADLVIPITEWLAHILVLATGCACAGSVPLPVDTEKFRPAPDPPRIEGRYALAVGGEGDVDYQTLSKVGASLRLVRVGPGKVRNCENLGFVSDIELRNLYSHAEFVVCLPTLEPYGMIPLEAMACGTPVVSTRYPGIGEYYPSPASHLIVESKVAVERLSKVVWEKGLESELRKIVRDHVVANYSKGPLSARFFAQLTKLS